MTDGEGRERDFDNRRAAGLDPIGEALRSTYDAENHDTLGKDLTGLMLALARVEPPAAPVPFAPAPTSAAQPLFQPPARLGWAARLVRWVRRAH